MAIFCSIKRCIKLSGQQCSIIHLSGCTSFQANGFCMQEMCSKPQFLKIHTFGTVYMHEVPWSNSTHIMRLIVSQRLSACYRWKRWSCLQHIITRVRVENDPTVKHCTSGFHPLATSMSYVSHPNLLFIFCKFYLNMNL